MRILLQELLERRLGGRLIAKVFFIDLAYREQRLRTVLAAWILAAEELVLSDRCVQVFLVGRELPSHLCQNLCHCHHARVRLRRRRSDVIHLAVRVGDLLVILAGALALQTPVQRLARALSRLKLRARLLLSRRRRTGGSGEQ